MLCDDNLLDVIRHHEANAVSVRLIPQSQDIFFKLADRSGLAVPYPVYAEYCQRVRPINVYGTAPPTI